MFKDHTFRERVSGEPIEVETSSGMSKLVVKGILTLPVAEGLKVEAYHAAAYCSSLEPMKPLPNTR